MHVRLTKGSVSVTLPFPKRFSQKPEALEFRALTTETKDALASFFKDTAGGMLETWTYIDAAGRSLAARFADPALVFVEFGRNSWDVSLRLDFPESIMV